MISTTANPKRRQSLMQQKEREKQEKQQKEQQDKQEKLKEQEKSPEKTSPEEQEQEKPAGPPEPSLDFINESELLYRGLLGDLHEDVYHDQTAMIVALYGCLT